MIAKFKKRYTWLASAGLLLALLLVASMTITPAAAQPPVPWETQQQFYGTVTINSAAASSGTTVAAYVGTPPATPTLAGSTIVDSQGRYGYSPLFNVTGTNGQTVTFKVGTADAPQSATFQGGAPTRLNLSVITTSLAVSTSAATNAGSRTATLNGNLTNMGGFSPVTVKFEYGTTTSYGTSTATQSKTAIGTFTADISGLAPSTLYNYRAVATSGSTTVYGGNMTFNTNPSALSVATNDATSVTASGATLNGNLTDLGSNSSVQVYFEYGTTQSYGSSTTPETKPSAGTFNKPVTGLLADTIYHFRAVAAGSTTVYGADKTFTTSVGTLAVTTGSAMYISATTATLNGTLTGLGANPSANVYFQYGPTISYGSTTPMQSKSSVGAFSAAISGLSPSTTYNFRAVAQAGGSTINGSNATFITPASTGGTSPPHQFYGNVYVSGALAPSGTAVAAYVNGSLAASTTTDSSGRYGYTTLFLVPGTSGGTVTFYVGGTLVSQTATWSSGGMSRLNLYSTQTALTVTCSATYATATTATLSGTVTSFGPSDTSAAVSFEWGTSPSSLTTVTSSPSTVTAAGQSFTATKTALTAGTTYYYRAKAVGNASGTAYCPTSGTNTYIHTACSGTLGVTTNDATTGSGTATLSGTLTGVPASTSATLYFDYYPQGGSYPGTTVAGSPSSLSTCGGFTASLSGLTNGTVYTYRAKAVGSTTVYGLDKTFTPGISTKLIGTGATGTATGSIPIVRLVKFTASGDGNISQIRVYSLVGGNVKVALYRDSAGAPGSLLNANNASTACTAGQWNTISLTATPVTNGIAYWIGVADETGAGACYSYTNPILVYWKYITYSSYEFPNPAGSTGYTISTPYYMAYTGWGN